MASAAAVCALLILAAAGYKGAGHDFGREAWPAYHYLMQGRLSAFAASSPAYAGSLVLRAPFALLPSLWHGRAETVYLASVLPCLLVLAGFFMWLTARAARAPLGGGWKTFPLLVCFLNPFVVVAVTEAHPEDVLGAVLCILSVAMALKGRAGVAGLLLGLAVANKPWALVAAPVVMATLPGGRRTGLAAAAAVVTPLLGPILLIDHLGSAGSHFAVQTGTIFFPTQLLWWAGARSWVAVHAHIEIVLLPIPLAGAWWMGRRRRSGAGADAFLLLALVFLLRAALDPWNNLYYHMPFLLALCTHELTAGRRPWGSCLCLVVYLLVVPIWAIMGAPESTAALVYAGVALVTIGWMVWRLYFARAPALSMSEAPSPRKAGLQALAARAG